MYTCFSQHRNRLYTVEPSTDTLGMSILLIVEKLSFFWGRRVWTILKLLGLAPARLHTCSLAYRHRPLPLQASLGILLQVSTLSPSLYRLFISCLRTCIHTVSRECRTSQDGPHGHAQQPRLTRKSNFLCHRSYTLLMDGHRSYLHS